ncbi:MAG: YjiH family protein [Synergistaceae bacterium]|nr:YjiH family protein [Synergistaceae bacterium]
MAEKHSYTSAQIMHFLIPSLIGAIVFLLPIPMKGSLNTILGIAIDWGKAVLNPWLPGTAMTLVVIAALASLWATLCKPEKIEKDPFWGGLLIVKPFWLVSRLLGAALYIVIFFKIGPEVVWNMDNGGTPAIVLAPALLIIFIVLAGVVPLLTDYGLMEYVGTYARPVMGPMFKLPGRSAVDCLASWVGSCSVAVVITTKVHDQGYYSDREASIITTAFSVISIAYIYVMADFVGLPNMYFQIMAAVYAVTFILALIMPRIWPLSSMPDTFSGKAGKQRVGDDIPQEYSLGDWALKLAVERSAKQTAAMTVDSGVKTFISLVVSTMPLVVAWGTIVLIIANNTPVFQILSAPFAWCLQLMRIPEAKDVAPAFLLAYADQFLAAVVGSGRTAVAAKFMCACISGTGLIYMTEVGVLILQSSIPLGFWKLTGIYFIRAVLSIFLLAPFAWFFC